MAAVVAPVAAAAAVAAVGAAGGGGAGSSGSSEDLSFKSSNNNGDTAAAAAAAAASKVAAFKSLHYHYQGQKAQNKLPRGSAAAKQHAQQLHHGRRHHFHRQISADYLSEIDAGRRCNRYEGRREVSPQERRQRAS